jgi:hypothetical protein
MTERTDTSWGPGGPPSASGTCRVTRLSGELGLLVSLGEIACGGAHPYLYLGCRGGAPTHRLDVGAPQLHELGKVVLHLVPPQPVKHAPPDTAEQLLGSSASPAAVRTSAARLGSGQVRPSAA